MQQVLTPEQFDEIRPHILKVPGLTQDGLWDQVSFPMWPAHEVVRNMPRQLMGRWQQGHGNIVSKTHGLEWRIFWLESTQLLREGSFNGDFLDSVGRLLASPHPQFNFIFRKDCYPVLSKKLGVVRISILIGNKNGRRVFSLNWWPNSGSVEASCKNPELRAAYLKEIRKLLASQLTELEFPGCRLSDWGVDVTEEDSEHLDFRRCWESALQLAWLRDELVKAPVFCHSGVPHDREWDFSPGFHQHWANLLEMVSPVVERWEGEFGFGWSGFPSVEPQWLEVASVAARLTANCGPIPIRLGDVVVPSAGRSRAALYAIRVPEGMLLSVKGGRMKLLDLLTLHFCVPWLQGVSPVPLPKKLDWTPVEPDSRRNPPVKFKRIPPFFMKPGPQDNRANIAQAAYLQMLETCGMFAGYGAEAKKRALETIDESFRPANNWQNQLITAIGFWKEPDASGEVREVITDLAELSFGLFEPRNLRIEFEDEDDVPEPGSSVTVSFELAAIHHEMTAEYFHGSFPEELLPFIQKSMEASCHGVAWRPVVPAVNGSQSRYYTLCTAPALEQIRAHAAVLQLP